MYRDFQDDFGPFDGKVWLNCSHQGPLPRIAADEAREAISWKVSPFELTHERFAGIPARLRSALGRLIGAEPTEIVLGNSASYGVHLIANAFPWEAGDEVLLVRDDFPTDLLPWLALEERGVRARYVPSAGPLPTAEEVGAALTEKTKLFCTTWVHSFSGAVCDLRGVGDVCRSHDVRFVVNASQAVGARPLDVSSVPVDAVVGVGFKWLCGPYGTGYVWMRPDLLASLRRIQTYWLAQMTADDLGREGGDLRPADGPPTAGTFDVFGTANFFNFKPWAASIEYLLGVGIDTIEAHDQRLVQRLLDGLDRGKFQVHSSEGTGDRSTLVVISHADPARNEALAGALKSRGVFVSFRRGKIRISPHLYNTAGDIDRALAILHEA
jgi:selenocysteine lyase/cysteine desulfurase